MQFIVKTQPEELLRAKKWWNDLEGQWKLAFNEAVYGKGPVFEPPSDDELMILLLRADTLRFAGPLAMNPNMSTQVTNLSGLIPLYHLKYLSISHSRISSLEELTRHTNLEHLFVYDNQITSLKGIEGMKNLKNLYFQNNLVSSFKPAKKLHQLEVIYATNNKFTELKGITKKHSNNLQKFYIIPNEGIKDRDVIQFQNKVGIICRKG